MVEAVCDASVVIPTYNRAETIQRAVESALQQDGVTVEVIVVDDGSTDHSAKILAALEATHAPALRVIHQANAGASAARNTGLDAAQGRYVQFLDSDDVLDCRKLSKQIDIYQAHPDTDIVLCQGWLETSDGDERIGLDLGDDPQAYLERMCGRSVHVVQTSAPLWRRTFLMGRHYWNPKISLGDDLEFHARCLADAHRIACLSEALFTVCQHNGDRLSDFSYDMGRLTSLAQTRIAIHDALSGAGRWTPACAAQMAEALGSIFAIYLQSLDWVHVKEFEAAAARICGPRWRSAGLTAMAAARALGGRSGARYFFALSQAAKRRFRGFTLGVWRARSRKIVARLLQHSAPSAPVSWPGIESNAKRALFVELNSFHTETIPGYSALLSEAGYEVTILARDGLDVDGALSRLPEHLQPKSLISATLPAMRQALLGNDVEQFDLVVFGSGTLAERDIYFGGVLDYLGKIPEGRQGHIMIEHSLRTFLTRGDKLHSDNLYGLRRMDLPNRVLPMLAPVEFGPSDPSDFSFPVQMAVVGRLEPGMRDVEGLFSAIRQLLDTDGPEFQIVLIGGAELDSIPKDIRPVFRALGRLPFPAMYTAIDQAHTLLPLLCSQTQMHRRYLRLNTTGTRQLSLGFQTPMVIDEVFAKAYNFDSQSAILHAPGTLAAGLDQARKMTPDLYRAKQAVLLQKKQQVMQNSLTNLRAQLGAKEALE